MDQVHIPKAATEVEANVLPDQARAPSQAPRALPHKPVPNPVNICAPEGHRGLGGLCDTAVRSRQLFFPGDPHMSLGISFSQDNGKLALLPFPETGLSGIPQ